MSVFVCERHFWRRQMWRHPHVTMLQRWAKFSNPLVRWSIRMIRARNYKTVAKIVKVMPRILWPLFSWTRWMYMYVRHSLLRMDKPQVSCSEFQIRPNKFNFWQTCMRRRPLKKGRPKGRYSSSWEPHLRATGRHLAYGHSVTTYLPLNTHKWMCPA